MACANLEVVAQTDLAPHHDIVSGRAAAGDADLGAEQVVAANPTIVADHDQIVDLRATADPCRAYRAPVD